MKQRKSGHQLVALILLLLSSLIASASLADGSIEDKKPSVGTIFTISGLKYQITSSSTVSFVGLLEKRKTIDIPANVEYKNNSFQVTSVANYAVADDTKICTLNIGKNVQIIGLKAFASCINLQKVNGGAGIVTLRASAFSGCKKLRVFPVLKKLRTIEDAVFKGDKKLPAFTFEKSVKYIGKNAFAGCVNLRNIIFKTVKLSAKSIKTDAFKNIHTWASVTCPPKRLNGYRDVLRARGVGKYVAFFAAD